MGSVLEIVGVAAVLAAAWAWDTRAGVALVGIIVAGVGYAIADPRRARKG